MEFIITEKVNDPTICLNMIVKNESHIIKDTLEKLCSKIKFSYWVICDTGSSDNTREIIKDFFASKNIFGELYQDEWINFAHNRTLALQYAYNKTDLLMVFDADDEIVGDIQMPKLGDTKYDEYHLQFGSPIGTSYTRVLLINNTKRFIYQSVLHEFISCTEPGATTTKIEGNYYVVSGRSGSRNRDPEKYLKDAKVLEAAHAEAVLKKDPLYLRYAFYCANSYKDYGLYEEAIKWYKITLGQDNWDQEKYMSCLCIYDCYEKINQKETGFFYLVKSFKYDTERIECLYPLLVHYCCEGQHNIAYNYYLIVQKYYENNYLTSKMLNKLFIQIEKYDFYLPYYMIIIADRMKDFECGVKMFQIIFTKKMNIDNFWFVSNLLYNLQFFVNHVKSENKDYFISSANNYFKVLYDLGHPLNTLDFLKEYDIKFGIDVSYIFLKIDSITTINKNSHFSKEECASSKNILIYTGFLDIEWNYSHLKNNALGGSEKAVAYLSKCFPKEYNIYVSGCVKNEMFDNLSYIHLNQLKDFIKITPFHTVIVSRYISFYEMFKECSYFQSFIWAHDTQLISHGCNLNDNQILKKWDNHINGCVCLTEWHKNLFIERYPLLTNKITLINNGLDLDSFSKNNKIKKQTNKFIYSSRPERGLNILLQLWPQILIELPDAELVISNYGVEPETDLMNIIKKYDNIKYLGKLNTEQLYAEMSTAEYWLYPTEWPETSCITALEMLMSKVICLYFPLAGLINTVGKYGITVLPGNEIETIVSLTNKQKNELRENGRVYALSCSWSNRAKEWGNLLFRDQFTNNNIKPSNIKNIAIFNSFPFHYEMFGYIIEYCQSNNYYLTIFTSFDNTLGWLEFYKNHFQNYHFEITDILKYKELQETFDITFITTDDDYAFINEWINDKCVVVDHTSTIRRPEYKHRIGTRPFINNYRDWIIPCYKVFEKTDKTNLLDPTIHIALIGGDNNYNYDLINKIYSDNQIQIHVISRNALFFDKKNIKELINITIYNNIETTNLFNLLKNCDYILTDFTYKMSHINGTSMSGNIPLAFSTLTPLIISKQNNALYKFKNVVEFDIETTDKICIDKNIINCDKLVEERNELISMFSIYIEKSFGLFGNNKNSKIPKKIYQTWETKNLEPEFQKIVDTWKINNPEYEYHLFDKYEREDFIKNNFDINVFDTYNMIIPGANKCDFWRYCYLYIYGGVYIDIDSLCLDKLDHYILDNTEFVVPIDLNINLFEGNHNLACGFIATIPNHPILLNCIERIVYIVKNNIITQSVLDFTGPGLLGRCVNSYLENPETKSFVGKEGVVVCKNNHNIHFLKFEKNTEYVKDLQNNILFQNKNGNSDIIKLYNNECDKIKNYVNWYDCPVNMRIKHPEKNIALMIYGQFRTYKNNLRKNINMLKPIFKNYKVHVFILSDKKKSGNYSTENENDIKDIFKEFNFNIHLFDYMENYDNTEEVEVTQEFFKNIKNNNGIENDFVPTLMYRKYLLNKLKNNIIQNNNINIDLTMYCRLFDTKIKNNLNFDEIENNINSLYYDNNILFGSSDTLFLASSSAIDYLFSLSNLYKNGIMYHDSIWENNDLVNFIHNMDFCLCNCKATYSPEIQYISHIYYSNYKYKNIRFDYNNANSVSNKNSLYHIILDPNRKLPITNSIQNNFILTKKNIDIITNNIQFDYRKYYSNQGILDYNMGIGKEHYKLFATISQHIKNGIIIDIGTHNGNSAVAFGYSSFLNNENDIYSFDINNMLKPECKDFFDKYAIQYRLENLFDIKIRDKYKNLLLSSSLIFIDIDPHDGILEYEMYCWLKENLYQGFIIYDDIFLKKGHTAGDFAPTQYDMTDFWNKIPSEEKIDLTNIGHWSGTGLVCFNFDKNIFFFDY